MQTSIPDALLNQAEAAAKKGRLFRLVDPFNAPSHQLGEKALATCSLISNPFFDHPRKKRLYLQSVRWNGANAFIDNISQEQKALPGKILEPVAFCGWLISGQAGTTVARYLQRHLKQPTPEGKPALLRFYDPRVLERLTHILSPAQRSSLLGPVDQWLYFDHYRNLKSITPHGDRRRLGGLHLLPEQWKAIRRIGQVNRCLSLYQSMAPQAAPEPDVIDSLLAAAERHGIRERQEMTAFALHGLTTHEMFYQHPMMQSLLMRYQAGQGYISLTDQLTREDWEAISVQREAV